MKIRKTHLLFGLLSISLLNAADRSILASFFKFREPLPPPSAEECLSTYGLVTARHIEAGGIGYQNGYTSLTGFATFPLPKENKWMWPVFDLRVHEFNNNRQAVNAGFGVRFAPPHIPQVFGGNLFYDYRNTKHGSYSQIGIGAEFLGKRIDVRANGYIPVGHTKYVVSHCSFTYPGGHFMSRKKTEVSLGGVNVEVGAFIAKVRSLSFYTAAGPYYFHGDLCHGHVMGGEIRFAMDFMQYLYMEARVSYDNAFKTRAQGILGVSVPLGCKPARGSYWGRQFPKDVLTLPIQRHEIIVLEKKCSWKTNF